MESYIIKITGDIRKIVPVINSFLEGERRRLRRKGVFFNVEQLYRPSPEEKQENKPDIVADYL
jgi:hypothetical protein